MIKTLINAIMITACAAAITTVAAGQAAPIPPKQRIEREFRLLETALARCMYEEVIPSPDMEFMNRALFEFMRDNPGVTRILRVNAGGFTVNDVTAESPRSAPPRSVSGQRWFQHISQGKAPYYSMEVTPDGQITLFYAWPLTINSGLEMTVTGGFAASIDLVSQIALIDDAPPFRILHAGKAIFEHDWEGLDYEEEPLPVKGVKDMTIQTLKPMLTRLDPRAPSKSKPGGAQSAQKRSADISDYDDDEDEEDAAAPGKKKKNTDGNRTNKILLALLILITLMLVYSMFSEKISRAVRAWNDTRSMKAIGRTTTTSIPIVTSETLPTPTTTTMPIITATTQPPQTQQTPMLPPQPIVTKIISNERAEKAEKLFKEQQKTIAKMAELIRKKIDVMESKIETLSKKVEVLEKNRN
ncbi:MAG: hypothetical protein LBC59_01145 [Chitinispirillales bacterium]|nr:hypothetical protein [Chitinispirillales bacterium]